MYLSETYEKKWQVLTIQNYEVKDSYKRVTSVILENQESVKKKTISC